jgi:hypothetical protein
LNRQQRRQENRKKTDKVRTYNLSQEQLDSIIKEQIAEEIAEMRKETLQYATSRVIAVLTEALHDEFDFGAKRLQRFLDRANTKFECIDQGYVTLEDIYNNLDNLGVQIR